MSNIMPPLALLGCAGHVRLVPGTDEPAAMIVLLYAYGLPAQPSGMPLYTVDAWGAAVYEMLPCARGGSVSNAEKRRTNKCCELTRLPRPDVAPVGLVHGGGLVGVMHSQVGITEVDGIDGRVAVGRASRLCAIGCNRRRISTRRNATHQRRCAENAPKMNHRLPRWPAASGMLTLPGICAMALSAVTVPFRTDVQLASTVGNWPMPPLAPRL